MDGGNNGEHQGMDIGITNTLGCSPQKSAAGSLARRGCDSQPAQQQGLGLETRTRKVQACCTLLSASMHLHLVQAAL
jgi:hypothetical protein